MAAFTSVGLPLPMASETALVEFVRVRGRVDADTAEGLHHLVVTRVLDEHGRGRVFTA